MELGEFIARKQAEAARAADSTRRLRAQNASIQAQRMLAMRKHGSIPLGDHKDDPAYKILDKALRLARDKRPQYNEELRVELTNRAQGLLTSIGRRTMDETTYNLLADMPTATELIQEWSQVLIRGDPNKYSILDARRPIGKL